VFSEKSNLKCAAYGDIHTAAEKTNFGGQASYPQVCRAFSSLGSFRVGSDICFLLARQRGCSPHVHHAKQWLGPRQPRRSRHSRRV
jgi:hypothetical protein